MASATLKIFACGDVDGKFDQLFSRISAIQKKNGTFDLLLCVGDFFGSSPESADAWKKYQDGSSKVPISTLILGPNKAVHTGCYSDLDGEELCANVTYLGRKGIFTGSSGLQIAYLSGQESSTGEASDVCFSKPAAASLISPTSSNNKFKGVDILMTSQWPKGVEKYATEAVMVDSGSCGSEVISEVARSLRPRYHFVGQAGIHYERQPYRNHIVLSENARHVSRFIALARIGNKEKKKYLYAFNIVPLCHMDEADLISQPSDVTESPYKPSPILSSSLPDKNKDDSPQQFFYDMKSQGHGNRKGAKRKHGDGGGERHDKKPAQPTGPCWFCLGSPDVEKHLVVSVGTETYLALAKGALVSDHVLILPITHYQSTVSASSDVLDEIQAYKTSLTKFFKSQGKAVVFFERNFRTQHLQIQVVPIPLDLSTEVKDSFMECAAEESLDLNEIPKHSDIKQIVREGAPYFYAELPTGEKLLHRISKSFPLQFGREALSGVTMLNIPERVDWRNCKISKEKETELATTFKSEFQEFDFTLE